MCRTRIIKCAVFKKLKRHTPQLEKQMRRIFWISRIQRQHLMQKSKKNTQNKQTHTKTENMQNIQRMQTNKQRVSKNKI